MHTVARLDSFLGKHLSPMVFISTIVGVSFPAVFSPLTRFSLLLMFALTFINSLDAGFRDLWACFRRPAAMAVILGLIHLVSPLVALATGRLLFPADPLLTTGLVLEFAIPTGVMALVWASISGGNGPLTLSIVLLDNLLAPFLLPLTLKVLVGSQVQVAIGPMMKDLMIMVGIPAILAMSLHQVLGREKARKAKKDLGLCTKLVIILIAASNSSGIADEVRSLTPKLVWVTLVSLVLCILCFYVGYKFARLARLDHPSSVSASLNTGLRNISAGAVLARAYFPAEVLFPVVICTLFMQMVAAESVKRLKTVGEKLAAQQKS